MANQTHPLPPALARLVAASFLASLLAAPPAFAQGGRRPRAVVRRPAPTAPAAEAGIWEPVNYPHDISLTDVFFVTADEGWAAGGEGGGGVVIHTTDGGRHWEEALGDPDGTQDRFYGLQFVDEHTGFVAQVTRLGDHALARTTDGQNWTVTGTVPQFASAFRFLSATVGVTQGHHAILRTTDAGRTWKQVFDCSRLPAQVDGLTRNVECEAASFSFPTPTTGFAIGGSPQVNSLVVFRTDDAGQTWRAWLAVPGERGDEAHVFFTDENTGYACLASGKLYGTADGGRTWSGLPGAGCENKAPILFADPEVGWALRYGNLTYTTDGGKRWVSRRIAFPAGADAFSFPRRDRAYAVGDHGMVYRYRVVAAGTAVGKGAVAAPAMPDFPTGLGDETGGFVQQVDAIERILADSSGGSATAFGQDNSGIPFVAGSATDANGAASSGGAPAAFITKCCMKRLSGLDLILSAVGGLLPDYLSKYRNLNLVVQGLRTAGALPERLDSLRSAVKAFRSAPDRPTAAQALAAIKASLAGFQASVDTAVQTPAIPFQGGSQ